ncbi:MAG: mechanosensitive ion channel protein MscS [Gammaproteobacteria bacterium]|jgi:MscS family membrane protein|nr:mechanosensitive ion channel protein MscS [Gammaproteobacteria bacterium]|tara:strand:+ start:266 stop:1312 length:1047 start_codon:yes stop_codon:yes gene_type:complete
MNDIDFLTIEAMTNIGVIVGITLLTILIIRTIVVGSLLKIAGKTDSVHDDAIVGALKKPLTLIPIGIALFAILQEINLDETYQSYGELLIKSYFYLAVFWSLADAITPVRDFVGEKYDFLTPTLRNWIFRTLKFIAYLVGVVSVLELWGVDAASIIAGLGLFSVALALGAQNFFKNLIGGLLIIGEKRFKQGDWINIEGVAEGEVEKIDFRSTLIRRFDKAPIFVPNSVLSDSEIINFSEMPFRRIRFNVGLIYQTTPETILNIRKDIEDYVAKNDDLVNADEATTTIRVTQFNDSSIDLLIYCFTKSTRWYDYTKAKEDLILEIIKIVKNNGSDFAYPTQTIHLEKD